ncbi:eg7A [Symbiodinium natans]|uniref:Eg7A protein n=1 Tax=Symbiodinium natans TaxID=878477 RepID=A0A812KAU0_9DINO|nr:eg7A [Symbiodinium natans]
MAYQGAAVGTFHCKGLPCLLWCFANRTRRGHTAFKKASPKLDLKAATAAPPLLHADEFKSWCVEALQTNKSSAAFQINEDGVWNTYFLPYARICDQRTLEYGIGDKFFLMKHDTTYTCSAENFKMLQLPGKTFSATIYLNGAGCGCNVGFYLVAMPAWPPGDFSDCYCDANCEGENCCNEFDLNNMNTHALQVTNHLCGDPPTRWNCSANGSPVMRFTTALFGPGNANTIDTEHPFNYSVQFRETDSESVLVTVQQGEKVISNTMANSALSSMWPQLSRGMVLVFDYWESIDLTWLDAPSCQVPSYCSGNKVQVSNVHITTNGLNTTLPTAHSVQSWHTATSPCTATAAAPCT